MFGASYVCYAFSYLLQGGNPTKGNYFVAV
jgi:hypothetical protein